MTLPKIARQAALEEYIRQTPDSQHEVNLDLIAERVAVAVLQEVMAFVRDHAAFENHVVAPGMWVASGLIKHQLLPQFSPSTPEAQK